jgi:ankyrin repeat protein
VTTHYQEDWSPETRLLHAAASDDAAMVRSLVADGVPVDTTDTSGEPALHLAVRLEKPQASAALLQLGADVHARGPTGKTVVHFLAAYPKTLALLPDALGRGADLDAEDDFGQTPLMTALLRGHLKGARTLLELGADPCRRDNAGGTVVYHFVAGIYGFRRGEPHTEQLVLLRELVALGVDPNAPGPFGMNALTQAAEKGLADVVAALGECGGDLAARDARGVTPLQAAAVHGQRREAMTLLAAGAPLDFCSAAALGMDREVMDFLAGDATLARSGLASLKTSALSLAIRHGHGPLVRLLLTFGADPNAPDLWTSSLHSAIRHLPDAAVFRLLIERGANVEAVDGDLNSPLNFAVRDGRIDLATILLDAGASPNAPTDRGMTPLQFATNDEMREFLRSRGAR